jgi:endonuclease G, mitochondrial
MSDFLSLIANAEKRYYNRNIDVESVLRKIRLQGKSGIDDAPGNWREANRFDDEVTKERVFGSTDFLHISYLEKGLKASKTVGRIVLKNKLGNIKGYGTGFLVSPGLLLTNNHVIQDEFVAANSEVEFEYEYDINGKIKKYFSFAFETSDYFLTSPADKLDYTLIGVKNQDKTGLTTLDTFGYMRLAKEESDKLQLGQCLSIIQHPRGELKQITVRENKLIDIDGSYLRYQTDTAPGSSGSMVTNDEWEVVGLHHSGVPKRDNKGNILAKNGNVWDKNTMREEDVSWIANEGVKIADILNDVQFREQSRPTPFNLQLEVF